MSFAKYFFRDAAMARVIQQGDIQAGAEIVATLTTVGAGALTGALLANNILSRTGPVGAVADTVDTANNILTAVTSLGYTPQVGDTWRLRYINNVAFAITITGVTGVTVTNGIVNASSVKDFLLTFTNATPTAVKATATTTNASAVVTGITDTTGIAVGQLVSGTGISAATTVISVQPGVGVTLSANATATNTNVTLTFAPTATILGLGQGLL